VAFLVNCIITIMFRQTHIYARCSILSQAMMRATPLDLY